MKSRLLRAAVLAAATVVFTSSSFAAPPKQPHRDGTVLQKIFKVIKSIRNLVPVSHEDLGPPKP